VRIANPILDCVFKYLMEDAESARVLISNIIGEEIESLAVKPQENTVFTPAFMLTVYRLDYKAVIKTKEGEKKKVLIELQKGKQPFDVARFRRYLGENYSTQDTDEDGIPESLPIITIYFLGFKLNIAKSVLKINRVYLDVVNNTVITEKSDFIELLSHNSYIIQIPYLPRETQNKLERVLSVFSQKWVKEIPDGSIRFFDGDIDEEPDLKILTNRLTQAASSKEVLAAIKAEEDLEADIVRFLRQTEKAIEEKEQIIEEKEQIIEEKEQIIQEEKRKNVELLKEIELLKLRSKK
jgi:hypothetical protein